MVSGHPTQKSHPIHSRDFFNIALLNMDPQEIAMQKAITDLNPGVFRSERAAACAWWHKVP
jgi:hypothetical protein